MRLQTNWQISALEAAVDGERSLVREAFAALVWQAILSESPQKASYPVKTV